MLETDGPWDAIVDRVRPGAPLPELGVPDLALWAALGAGVLVVAVPALWRLLRVAVTVVHELGHAVVGVLVGRSFTGLVLRADMSGHAVTVGRSRGAGRVATTWAGYPAPALVGAGLVLAAAAGWAAPVLLVVTVLLLGGLLRARSVYTVAVLVVTVGGAGWLWWAGAARVQGLVLLAVGLVLLLGAWRHLGAALRSRDPGSDPAVLARITRVPRVVWVATFVLVLAGASGLAVERILLLLGR
ncbi:M50 family metallopeptidase [Georgenia sp. H159]|uniref:M50 family metallopeptidase n=1 Tax=Georgenia sp. H159 TaxID=3076115 RepID=UPI002D764DA5|nr:M50 family metallopeptidase [Georgenia sp. H159]